MYQKLSGMTGTAVTEAEEFHKIYKSDYIDNDSDNLPKRNWYAPKQSNEKFFNT